MNPIPGHFPSMTRAPSHPGTPLRSRTHSHKPLLGTKAQIRGEDA